MNDPKENVEDSESEGSVSGTLQKIIGEVEAVGGVLTGNPGAVEEGEFNIGVGEIREELENDADPPSAKE